MPVPPEAILLRLASEHVADFAREIIYLHGILDGRIVPLLNELASSPMDAETRKNVAETAILAPWRLVREDPCWLLNWRTPAQSLDEFPKNLEQLMGMLSEPGWREAITPDAFHDRFSTKGTWHERLDGNRLAKVASEVPGLLPTIQLNWRLREDQLGGDARATLERVKSPENLTIGKLAADIAFLLAADQRHAVVEVDGGEVELRSAITGALLNVMRAEVQPASEGTIADVEARLLRVCAEIVREVAIISGPPGLDVRNGLWLTWRLFQWVVLQLNTLSPSERSEALLSLTSDAPPPREMSQCMQDLLDPYRFAPGRVEHRVVSVLFAVWATLQIPLEDVHQEYSSDHLLSEDLEALLQELVSRDRTSDEIELLGLGTMPSALPWEGPGAVPDLALAVLLTMDPGAFMRLPLEVRVTWLERLPNCTDKPAGIGRATMAELARAVGRCIVDLNEQEFDIVLNRATYMAETEEYFAAGFVLLTLCIDNGAPHAIDLARTILTSHHTHTDAGTVLLYFLHAVENCTPGQFDEEIDYWVNLAPGLETVLNRLRHTFQPEYYHHGQLRRSLWISEGAKRVAQAKRRRRAKRSTITIGRKMRRGRAGFIARRRCSRFRRNL